MTVATHLVERLRDETRARVYVACAGGGAGLQQLLWSAPGASSFLVGASFPYAEIAVDDFLGFTPEQYCSAETAIDLATASFLRAGAGADALGVGLTASVASIRAHRGPHRIYAASVACARTRLYSVELERDSGRAAREVDGNKADHLGLVALLDAAGLPSDALASAVGPFTTADGEPLARERFFARPAWRASGKREPPPDRVTLAFPGTFDPPHAGHLGMAAEVAAETGHEPLFWITAEPPHKAAVPITELVRRARLLYGHDVLFTRGEPLYIDKARRYPGCHFVIGTDALARMLDPKWGLAVDALVEEFRRLGTRFYVTSRVVDGSLVTLRDLPDAPKDLCVEVAGRWDVSSTELRRTNPP
jgi:nicotinic acid mononucleotide adenylyltransferase